MIKKIKKNKKGSLDVCNTPNKTANFSQKKKATLQKLYTPTFGTDPAFF